MTEEEARTKWPVTGKKEGHSRGYVRLLSKNHPNADSSGYVYEHTYFASLVLGRGLKQEEVVHHVDGDTANNNNSNLVICTHKYHRQLHERLSRSDDWPQFTTKKKNNKPVCKVAFCRGHVPYRSATGLCIEHYWESIRASKSSCKVPDCSNKAGMRSGLCREHVKHRSNKRRHNAGWDYNYG